MRRPLAQHLALAIGFACLATGCTAANPSPGLSNAGPSVQPSASGSASLPTLSADPTDAGAANTIRNYYVAFDYLAGHPDQQDLSKVAQWTTGSASELTTAAITKSRTDGPYVGSTLIGDVAIGERAESKGVTSLEATYCVDRSGLSATNTVGETRRPEPPMITQTATLQLKNDQWLISDLKTDTESC